MPITSIQYVVNNRDADIMFVNAEYSGNNREIPPQNTRAVGNCWIPWCTRQSDFPSHHIEIIDMNSGNILWYIWQQSRNDGDFVRASRTGFNEPTAIGGSAGVGRSNNLFISADQILAVDS